MKIVWPDDANTLPITMVNAVNVASLPDGIIITVGTATAPVLGGTAEEQIPILNSLEQVTANVLTRFVVTPALAVEFQKVIASALVEYSRLAEIAARGGDPT